MGDCFFAAGFLFKRTAVFRIIKGGLFDRKPISCVLMGFSMDSSLNTKLRDDLTEPGGKERRRLRKVSRWLTNGKAGCDNVQNRPEYADSNPLATGPHRWRQP